MPVPVKYTERRKVAIMQEYFINASTIYTSAQCHTLSMILPETALTFNTSIVSDNVANIKLST